MTAGTSFGNFRIVKTGSGANITDFRFKLDFNMTGPRTATRALSGTISSARVVTFDAPNYRYELMGSSIHLCRTSACSPAGTFSLILPAPQLTPLDSQIIYGQMSPIEPYRLVVQSTGYGPGSSMKRLEAVMQRNFFNDLGASSAISMIGPGANLIFDPGTSHQMDILGGSVPSVGVLDLTGLQTVNGAHTNGTLTPPPAVLNPSELPDWQQSSAAMDALIRQLRQTAQNSGRYFNGGPSAQQGWGDFTSGTGITFCEGSCGMGGNTSGGGILVITGTFTTSGNPKFKGLILAVGPYVNSSNQGGISRSGGGNEVFTGNIVIAPYDPNNLSAGFQCPRYEQNGGPGDTIYSDIDVNNAFGGSLPSPISCLAWRKNRSARSAKFGWASSHLFCGIKTEQVKITFKVISGVCPSRVPKILVQMLCLFIMRFFVLAIFAVSILVSSAFSQTGSLAVDGERHLTNIKQLTFGGENAEAYFSFDGKQLIFQSKRDGHAAAIRSIR